MFDSSLGIRIILRPKPDELVKVVGTKDWPISSEIVKVIHDDSHKKIENQKTADDEKTDEVEIGKITATTLTIRIWKITNFTVKVQI